MEGLLGVSEEDVLGDGLLIQIYNSNLTQLQCVTKVCVVKFRGITEHAIG